MNQNSLRDKLIRAARQNPPGDQVPHAFEKRIMARLRAQANGAIDDWTAIIRAAWRAAGACTAIAVAMSIWAFVPQSNGESAHSFSTELEQTILASVTQSELEHDLRILEGEFDLDTVR